MRRNNRHPLFPIIIFFVMLNILFIADKNFLERHGFDQSVLIIGNLILFGATLLSFVLATNLLSTSVPVDDSNTSLFMLYKL